MPKLPFFYIQPTRFWKLLVWLTLILLVLPPVLAQTAPNQTELPLPKLPGVSTTDQQNAGASQNPSKQRAGQGAQQAMAEPEAINQVPPTPQGLNIYVNDLANLLSPDDSATLRQRFQALDEAGIAQVSLLILPNTDQELAEFAPQIMNQWDIQHYKKRDGLLILVNAHRVRNHLSGNRIFVATGYALEPILTDAMVGRVLDQQALPAFEQNNFSGGVLQASLTLADILAGDEELRSTYTPQEDDINWVEVVIILIILLIFFNGRWGRFGGGGYYGGGDSGGGFGGGFGGGGGSSGGGGAGR